MRVRIGDWLRRQGRIERRTIEPTRTGTSTESLGDAKAREVAQGDVQDLLAEGGLLSRLPPEHHVGGDTLRDPSGGAVCTEGGARGWGRGRERGQRQRRPIVAGYRHHIVGRGVVPGRERCNECDRQQRDRQQIHSSAELEQVQRCSALQRRPVRLPGLAAIRLRAAGHRTGFRVYPILADRLWKWVSSRVEHLGRELLEEQQCRRAGFHRVSDKPGSGEPYGNRGQHRHRHPVYRER